MRDKKLCYNLRLSDEPQTFEVSNNYFMASLGTKVEIFLTNDENDIILKDIQPKTKDFYSQISMIWWNDTHLTVLCEGKAHLIDLRNDTTLKIFPLKDTEDIIHFICMTEDYLIYSYSNGRVKIFSIKDNCSCIGNYAFDNIIKKYIQMIF